MTAAKAMEAKKEWEYPEREEEEMAEGEGGEEG